MRCVLVLAIVGSMVACSESTDECAEDQIEVTYLGGARDDETVCKPRPAACPNPATCGEQGCIVAMYALCDAPYRGIACSDTFAPPIISCNP